MAEDGLGPVLPPVTDGEKRGEALGRLEADRDDQAPDDAANRRTCRQQNRGEHERRDEVDVRPRFHECDSGGSALRTAPHDAEDDRPEQAVQRNARPRPRQASGSPGPAPHDGNGDQQEQEEVRGTEPNPAEPVEQRDPSGQFLGTHCPPHGGELIELLHGERRDDEDRRSDVGLLPEDDRKHDDRSEGQHRRASSALDEVTGDQAGENCRACQDGSGRAARWAASEPAVARGYGRHSAPVLTPTATITAAVRTTAVRTAVRSPSLLTASATYEASRNMPQCVTGVAPALRPLA